VELADYREAYSVRTESLSIPIYARLNFHLDQNRTIRLIGEAGFALRFYTSMGIKMGGTSSEAGNWYQLNIKDQNDANIVSANAFQFGLYVAGGAGIKLGPGYLLLKIAFTPMFTPLHTGIQNGDDFVTVDDFNTFSNQPSRIEISANRRNVDLMFRVGYELGLF